MTIAPRFDHSRLEIVNRAGCLRLLQSVPIGRLVYTDGGLPAVRLVNFLLDGDTIVFNTRPGDKFRAAERGDVVAFEADEVDLERHVGWTVTALGRLSVVSADDAAALRRRLPIRSWIPMDDPLLVRVGVESVHGRRLVPWGKRPRDGA